MTLIDVFAIVFSIAYGITAYLSRRQSIVKVQSGDEESSLSDHDAHRLLLFTAFWYQWFVVGFPFGKFSCYVEVPWIESLFMIVGFSSLVFMLGGAIAILCNEHLNKARNSLKVANPKLMFASLVCGLAMIALLTASIVKFFA